MKARGTTLVVTWAASAGNGSRISRYRIDISKGTDKRVAGTVRKVTFKRLKLGSYRIRVAAQNASGWSPMSSWTKVRIK